MLDHKVDNADDVVASSESRSRPATRPFVRKRLVPIAVLAIIAGVVLGVRGWRPASTHSGPSASSSSPAVPVSAAIEAKYGIRFSVVAVTAGGGMIELQYQILDSDKTDAIHDAASAPFVVDSHGTKYADPGMVGHTHVGKTKAAGTTDYILLSNARGGVKPGSIVTIKIGDLELRNVRVL